MSHKGFSLIEMMASLAVGGMVLGALVPTIYQAVMGNARTNNRVVAMTDVNLATLWIKKDLQMAQTTTLVSGDPIPRSSVTLTWTDLTGFATAQTHTSAYALSDTKLVRTYDGVATTIARYITSLGFTQQDRFVTVTIMATAPDEPQRSQTLTFGTLLRQEVTP